MKTRVKEGVFRVMGGAIAKESPRNFSTETPAATIGIRGSMYAGRVAQGVLTVVFEGGRGIDVTNEAGRVSINRPGFGTRIQNPETPPEPPARFSSAELSDLNSDLGGESPPLDEEGSETAPSAQEVPAGSDTGTSDESSATGDGTTAQDQQPASESGDETQAGGSSDTDFQSDYAGDAGAPPAAPTASDAPIVPITATLTTSDTIPATQTWKDGYATTTLPVPVGMSGMHMSTLADLDDETNSSNTLWYNTVISTSQSVLGTVAGSFVAQDGTTFPFSFAVNPYNPSASYTPLGITTTSQTCTRSILGSPMAFDIIAHSDPLGEFAIYGIGGSITSTRTYTYGELGYLYTQYASSLPTDGLNWYHGPGIGFKSLSSRSDAGKAEMNMEINWLTGKAVGYMNFSNPGTATDPANKGYGDLYFFGTLDRPRRTDHPCNRFRGADEDDPPLPSPGSTAPARTLLRLPVPGLRAHRDRDVYETATLMTGPSGDCRLVTAGFGISRILTMQRLRQAYSTFPASWWASART
jgi:hypothetical protein